MRPISRTARPRSEDGGGEPSDRRSGTDGAGAHRGRARIRDRPELAPRPGELVIRKPGKGAFYATGLDETLRGLGLSHLFFAGVTTEVCVQTTMREANDRGYECLLVEDATESYFPAFKSAALAMIRAQGGIVGWTAPLRAVREGLVVSHVRSK